ncbi:MAG TPA: aminotransferase [Elusimicrobia bacterium]|nr:aminotransferase [Elusimicrobiota bacterium]
MVSRTLREISGFPSLSRLLARESLRRKEFPAVRQAAFLAHAAVCPLPARVAGAVSDYALDAMRRGQFERLYARAWTGARILAARLLGCSPDEIAFSSSTSAGLSLVASGLDWRSGDGVLLAEDDFPANLYPWLGLERRGVRVRFVPRRPDGSLRVSDVESRLLPKTRLVSLSSVHYLTGAVLDVDGMGRMLRRRGVLFCVDAIQSLGALPLSVRRVDFLAADAHKWLLGPEGIAIVYVRRERMRGLFPSTLGWRSVREPYDFQARRLEFPDSAARYEPGSPNALGLVGLHAALSLLDRVGIEKIAGRIALLHGVLRSALLERGCEVLGPSAGPRSGILSLRMPGRDMKRLHKALLRRKILVSLRSDSAGPCLRVSPHFYNTEGELGRLLEALAD